MAVLDAGGSLGLRPLLVTAAGLSAAYSAVPLRPGSGIRFPSRAVLLEILVSSSTALLTDVRVEVSVDPAFGTTVYSNTLTGRADGVTTVLVSALTDKTLYYWRASAAEAGTTGWSPWSAVWQFTPDLDAGKAFGFGDLNVGAEPTTDSHGFSHSDQNIGVEATPKQTWVTYSDFNAGVELTIDSDGLAYVSEGDVSANTPIPHLWWLSPPAARPTDGMRIFGFGLGDLASTFGAVVEMNYGGARGWQPVPAVSWQTYPADPEAYTAARMIDPSLEYIDVQHQVVEITVPEDAVPPGYSIRIRTEGP